MKNLKESQQSYSSLIDPPQTPTETNKLSVRQWFGLFFGPMIFFIMMVVPAPEGLTENGWITAAVGLLMAIWWITEAIPIPATSLIPLILFPPLGVGSMESAASPYANPLIFLFLVGFIIALGIQTWE